MIRVHVTPHPDNRELALAAETGDYFRSSSVQLDEVEAPATISLEMRNLPNGRYDVRGVLINSGGRARAAVRKEVVVLPWAGSE